MPVRILRDSILNYKPPPVPTSKAVKRSDDGTFRSPNLNSEPYSDSPMIPNATAKSSALRPPKKIVKTAGRLSPLSKAVAKAKAAASRKAKNDVKKGVVNLGEESSKSASSC